MTFEVARACIPDEYHHRDAGAGYDVALLKLSQPLNYTDRINPACIDFSRSVNMDRLCVAVGSGLTENDDNLSSGPLALPMIKEYCYGDKNVYGAGDDYDMESNSCWIDLNRRGNPCKGDSGGPMLCYDTCQEDRMRTFVMGALSSGSEDGCIPGLSDTTFYSDFHKIDPRIMQGLLDKCS